MTANTNISLLDNWAVSGDDLEEFKALYKKLADKMLPMVYEVGFLRK